MSKIEYERKAPRVWTVAEAKARLSEVLRRAEDEPQRIGARKTFVVVPAHVWRDRSEPREPLGRWLLENMPDAGPVEVPARGEGRERPVPFADWTEQDWAAFDRKRLGDGPGA